jgi:hypothetical protein
VYLLCSHVRVESDRLVIVRDYGFFKREEGIPRHLIEVAEVVTTEVGGLERRRRVQAVQVCLGNRGCAPLVVNGEEEPARETGLPP